MKRIDLDDLPPKLAQVLAAVEAAGLVDVEWYRRGPVAAEGPNERLYVLGRRA